MDFIFRRGAIVAALLLLSALPVRAQSGFITGKVTRDTGEPMAGAAVVVEELKRESRTGEDGTYRFDNVPPGSYHVSVRAEGYSTRRTEVAVTPQGATLDLVVELDLHFAEVLSVSPNARAQFESYQPTSVLAGQDLQKQLEATIGATLQSEPGVAMRAFGPGPARPVIRGLDGDRVAVLQDGQRVGDLSSQSGDHGVTRQSVLGNADRSRARAGHAAVRRQRDRRAGQRDHRSDSDRGGGYGRPASSRSISGQTPARPAAPATSTSATAAWRCTLPAAGVATAIFRRRKAKSRTRSREAVCSTSAARGRASNTLRRRQLRLRRLEVRHSDRRRRADQPEPGASRLHDSGRRQGLDGAIHLVSRDAGDPALPARRARRRRGRHALRQRHRRGRADAVAPAVRPALGHRRRLVPESRVQRRRRRGAGAADRSARRRAVPLRGADLAARHVAVRRPRRSHDASSPTATRLPMRDFTEFSGSVGLLLRPAAANDNFVVALSLARAARNPALEELYFFGPHPGNFAFEIGNPSLASERALGFDVSLRARTNRVRGEVTFFTNSINDFIFRNPLTRRGVRGARGRVRRALRRRRRRGRACALRRVPVRRVRRRRQPTVRHRGACRRQADRAAWSPSSPSTWCAASWPTPTSRCRAFRRSA